MRTLSLSFLALCTSLIACGCAQDAALTARHDADHFSYGVGFDLGGQVRRGVEEDGIELDHALVRRGFADGLAGREAALPPEEIDRVLRSVHRELLERAARRRYAEDPEFRALADGNARVSAAAIQTFTARPSVRTLEEGVFVLVERSGTGSPVGEDFIAVGDWRLRGADGRDINAAQGAHLDPRQLLPLAARTLRQMRRGDVWSVAFEAERAYGLGGEPPSIGPNEALFLDVTVTDLLPRETSR